MAAFAIRVSGNETFRRAVKSLAAEDGVQIGDALAEALRAYYGVRLQNKIEYLSANDGRTLVRLDVEKSDG